MCVCVRVCVYGGSGFGGGGGGGGGVCVCVCMVVVVVVVVGVCVAAKLETAEELSCRRHDVRFAKLQPTNRHRSRFPTMKFLTYERENVHR